MDEVWLLSGDGEALFKLHIDVAEPIVPKIWATRASILSNRRPEKITGLMVQLDIRADVLDRIVDCLETLGGDRLECPSDTELWRDIYLAQMSDELLNDVLQEVEKRNKKTGDFHTHFHMMQLESWLSNRVRRNRARRRKPGRIESIRLWLAEMSPKYRYIEKVNSVEGSVQAALYIDAILRHLNSVELCNNGSTKSNYANEILALIFTESISYSRHLINSEYFMIFSALRTAKNPAKSDINFMGYISMNTAHLPATPSASHRRRSACPNGWMRCQRRLPLRMHLLQASIRERMLRISVHSKIDGSGRSISSLQFS